jgi:DNA helicase HerA-like ATPase
MSETEESLRIVTTLVAKMTVGLTEPQLELLRLLVNETEVAQGDTVREFIERLVKAADRAVAHPMGGISRATARVVRRTLFLIEERLKRMEKSNTKLRALLKGLEFEPLPDPGTRPEAIVRPGQVSVLYLGGYDHLTQSTIVSILMETLFAHRSELTGRIPPFLTVVEEAHNFVPSGGEQLQDTPSLITLRKVITEGRKFGVGLVLVSQRPSRVDETIMAQCNSFLVMRLVNPRDQRYVRSVMENLAESDARMLPAFGPGQGVVSGQAVRFPLLVKIQFDEELVGTRTGDENFILQAKEWKPDRREGTRRRSAATASRLSRVPARKKGTSGKKR